MDSLLGKKIGMTQVFDEAGNVVPVTVIEAGPCIVTQVKEKSVQLGFGKAKRLSKPMKGHLKEINARHLREFKVAKPEEFKVGQEIKADLFKVGEKVAVSGISVGKGFMGTVRRWHHHRGPMTHGSKSHRITGSVGAGTSPGHVIKGRRMAGRMGGGKVTVKNLKVVRIDPESNLLLVGGGVPGKEGNLITIRKMK